VLLRREALTNNSACARDRCGRLPGLRGETGPAALNIARDRAQMKMRGAMSEAEIARTGVIGLGAIGLQMARHMALKGFSVCGIDVDPDAAKRAAAYGVKPCASAAEVGDHADLVVVMVATDARSKRSLALPACSIGCVRAASSASRVPSPR
jgi:NAD binding domain of 6-phosphogluconate dehydrogenase